MKKEQKHEFVDYMKAELATAPAVVVADYRGLTVAQITALRTRCLDAGVKIKVAKNTLMKISSAGTPLSGVEKFLTGPTLIAWHPEDPGAAARVLTAFGKEKENDKFQIKGAAVTGRTIGSEEVKTVLATMPTKHELMGQVAGLLAAGPQRLVRVIAAGPNMLGRVLGALKDQRQGAGA